MATHQAVLPMHRYRREESFKPKDMPLAPQQVLEQKLLLVMVVENVIETRFSRMIGAPRFEQAAACSMGESAAGTLCEIRCGSEL